MTLPLISIFSERVTSSSLSVLRPLGAAQISYLYSNELASLPAGLFDGNDGLRNIYLNGNQLDSLPVELLDGLGSLRNLYLHGNQLASLPAGLLDGLDALQLLSPLLTDDSLFLPDGFEDGGICSCPEEDGACESDESCAPGTDGYTCSTDGGGDDELSAAVVAEADEEADTQEGNVAAGTGAFFRSGGLFAAAATAVAAASFATQLLAGQ
ncbi:Hypothetical leucine rich repeat protein kinase [Ectocarpus siliculosus]|uniref:Hypothetical leucine rich repeat protein kinase n=1 Tax=Ectocarpus siliculosus TaxID=2880 RepID=D8LGH9_ECTSI|nr:Hypothetical leucine rich repeat protein kinase [Ectocarpus siliculosus]|eukprot:CBN79036.1 Hypothetical leucine rich repeat protein kinase [Ectocarpus siliculosus]